MSDNQPFTDDRMMRVYAAWAELHPDGSIQDFAEFVRINSGPVTANVAFGAVEPGSVRSQRLSDLLTFEQAEFLMEQMSEDPVLAEALWEGMESGP